MGAARVGGSASPSCGRCTSGSSPASRATGDERVRPRPRLRGHLRRPGLRRQPRRRRLAAHRLPRAALPAGPRRRTGDRLRRRHRRLRARRGDGRPRCSPPRAGRSSSWRRAATTSSTSAPPHEPLRHFANDEIAADPPPPARPRPAAGAPHLPPLRRRRRPPPHRRGQQPAVHRRRRRRARRRQAPPLPRGGLPPPLGARARSTGAGVEDWPLAVRRPRTALRRGRARLRRGRRGRRQPVRGLAQRARSRCRPATTCRWPWCRRRPPSGPGCTPTGRPTGVNSVPYDGRPAVRRLRVLRRLRLPGPRQGRPDRRAAAGAAHRPVRAAARAVRHRDRAATPAAGGPPASATSTSPATPTRRCARCGPRGPWSSPAAPSRRRGCCCATASAATSSAATSRTTSRRSPSASSREPTGGERGRSVTHLHDDLMVDTPDAAGGRGRAPACRGCAAARRARRRAGTDRRGDHLPDRRATTSGRWPTAPCAAGCGCSPCRARTCPRPPTGSTSTRRCATPGASRPAGSPTPRTATSWRPRPTPPRSTRRCMIDAGAEAAFSATSPPQGDLDLHAEVNPLGHRPGQPPRDGHRPHGHRPRRRRWCPPSSGCGTSTTCSSATRRCS